MQVLSYPNRSFIIYRYSFQYTNFFLCVPHHIAGVARNTHFRASKHCCSCTYLLNLFKKLSTLLNPSYIGRSLTFVAMQRSDLVIMLQLSVVTSCNRFFHRSISSYESEVQELSRSHEILSSAIGFTQSYSCTVIL